MLSSHIIFSANDYQAATTLIKIMEKTGSDVPPEVRQLSNKAIEVTTLKHSVCGYVCLCG